MMLEQEYTEKLDAFVYSYFAQKSAMDEGDCDAMTKAMKAYMEASRDLLTFKEEAFCMDDPQLPPLDVFLEEDGNYCGFACSVFAAILDAGRFPFSAEWELFEKVYIGKLLKNILRGD